MMTEISKSNLWPVKDLAMMAESQDRELKRRLNLYEVFLKLYEHHGTLLDEILQLENPLQPSLALVKVRYALGVVDGSAVYVMTNLGDRTEALQQPQQIWTIGRDRSSGIYIGDRYLSRRHAAIQYIENKGFYLIDFKSTNGSFVNGKRTQQPIKLKDGDRIRLGNMTFDFFSNDSSRILPTVAMELLMQLTPRLGGTEETLGIVGKLQRHWSENLDKNLHVSQDHSCIQNLVDSNGNLNAEQQSEILDRFFSRSTPSNPS
ncbi:FHA domain-containing protein [Dendronalium sp. ChiSLP03b]|uniref:FHA domain-containing protein n=1 Tax=Dendronalium sp. ChiSLP03b TaxID=3075381 RepID=UPI002AD52D25|nr:FHA domain-containing protein [Dendronalium sp. ChiSLP03b]MDZ8206184.1 FHA domain-containing protein [Dendronalium sp. ChiSLP03b]